MAGQEKVASAFAAEPELVELVEVADTFVTYFGRPEDFGEFVRLPVYTDRLLAGMVVRVLVQRLVFPKAAYVRAVFTLAEEPLPGPEGFGPRPRDCN